VIVVVVDINIDGGATARRLNTSEDPVNPGYLLLMPGPGKTAIQVPS